MAAILRSLLGSPIAAFVVVVLFLIMYGLIRVDKLPDVEESEQVNIQIGRQIRDTELTNQRRLEKPKLDQPPPPPPAINNQSFKPSLDGVPAVAPTLTADVNISSGFNPDRDAQPIVRIPPSEADFQRCITSDEQRREAVTLEFDVTPDGQVTNVKVIDSTDSCYERSATRAAQRWKYNPKIVDGQPQPRFGVRTTIRFEVGGEAQ